MSTLLTWIRVTLKPLLSAKWTSLAAVLTLAVGTGANVAVLSVAYAALWRPIPVVGPERLVTIATGRVEEAEITGTVRADELERWRDGFRTLSGLAGWTTSEFTVRGMGAPQVLRVALVTDDFFDVLGAPPAAGRVWSAADADGVAVMSATLAVGQPASLPLPLSMAGSTLQVVGVMPADFPVPDSADLWVPAGSVAGMRFGSTGDFRSYRMVGRLASGVTITQAQDDADRVNREIEEERGRPNELRAVVSPLADLLIGENRPALLAFVVAAALLLMVACANVATLMVSRALSRRREYAVRLAIGARPAELVRSAFVESLALAAAGTVLGVALAAWVLAGLTPFVEDVLPRTALVALGLPALAAAVGAALLATMLAGVAPAMAAARVDVAPAFRSTTSMGSPGARRVRSALVVLQLTMAVVLLVGAGLFARTVQHLLATDLGIDPERAVSVRLRLTDTTGFDASPEAPRLAELMRRVRELPGVEAAGIGSNLPPSTAQVAFSVRVVVGDSVETRTFDFGSASPGYFEAIGARLLRGRVFEERDLTGPPVAVLSEGAARHLSDVGDPLDRPLAFSVPTPSGERVTPTVVGIIEDVRHRGLEQPANGNIYVLWSAMPSSLTYLAVRSARPADVLAPELARLVRDVSPAWPVPEVRTLEDGVRQAIVNREMRMVLVGAFATLAAGLAIAGLAGALWRSVGERRREMAIRSALGASPRQMTRRVLLDGLRISAVGVTAGLCIAAWLGRSAASLVYGISPFDARTFVIVGGGLIVVAAAAAWLPARRASKVDPVALLRSDG